MSSYNYNLSDDSETHISIIEQAKINDPDAWTTVTSLYSPLIRHWAWKKGVRCPHELDNVIQEVLKRVYHKLHTFSKEQGKGSFRGWLRTITHNFVYSNQLGDTRLQVLGGSSWEKLLDDVARDEPPMTGLFDSSSEDEKSAVESGLLFRRIMNWVRHEYSPVQASAFKGVVIDQRPARDVAEDLEISVNVVYQTKCRILKRIREVFSDIV